MIKLVTLIPRKPGMSREEFIDYYEKRHVPLAYGLFPQIAKYTRNYAYGENLHYAGRASTIVLPYDCVTEHWFEDQAAYDDMMAQFGNDPAKFAEIDQDEANFMDKEKVVMFLVEEIHSDL